MSSTSSSPPGGPGAQGGGDSRTQTQTQTNTSPNQTGQRRGGGDNKVSELGVALKHIREESRQQTKQKKEQKRLCYREIQGLADNIHQDFRAGVLKSLHAVSENQNQLKERIKALDNVLKQVKEETRSQIGTVTEFRRSCEQNFDGLRGWTYVINDNLEAMTDDLEYIADSLRNEAI